MELPFIQFKECSHALARSDQEERCLVHAAAVRGGSTWKFAGDPERDWTLTPHFSGSKLNASNALFCTQTPPCQHLPYCSPLHRNTMCFTGSYAEQALDAKVFP